MSSHNNHISIGMNYMISAKNIMSISIWGGPLFEATELNWTDRVCDCILVLLLCFGLLSCYMIISFMSTTCTTKTKNISNISIESNWQRHQEQQNIRVVPVSRGLNIVATIASFATISQTGMLGNQPVTVTAWAVTNNNISIGMNYMIINFTSTTCTTSLTISAPVFTKSLSVATAATVTSIRQQQQQ